MFYNKSDIVSGKPWNDHSFSYPKIIADSVSKQQAIRSPTSNMEFYQTNHHTATLNTGSDLKLAIQPSMASPAESLDSVGSLPISNMDNSNLRENMGGDEMSSIRYTPVYCCYL